MASATSPASRLVRCGRELIGISSAWNPTSRDGVWSCSAAKVKVRKFHTTISTAMRCRPPIQQCAHVYQKRREAKILTWFVHTVQPPSCWCLPTTCTAVCCSNMLLGESTLLQDLLCFLALRATAQTVGAISRQGRARVEAGCVEKKSEGVKLFLMNRRSGIFDLPSVCHPPCVMNL